MQCIKSIIYRYMAKHTIQNKKKTSKDFILENKNALKCLLYDDWRDYYLNKQFKLLVATKQL